MARTLSSWMVLLCARYCAALDVLGHHQADEFGVGPMVIEGEGHQRRSASSGARSSRWSSALDRADAAVGLFEHGQVQAFLAAEVVIDHALAGAHGRGDLVDARTGQALLGELARRDLEDVGHRALGIVGARHLLRRRPRTLRDNRPAGPSQRRMYCFVHFASVTDSRCGAKCAACGSAGVAQTRRDAVDRDVDAALHALVGRSPAFWLR